MLLSRQLKEKTQSHHAKTEDHPWVKLLFKNQLPILCYYRYLQHIHPVYLALEENQHSNGVFDTDPSLLARAAKIDLDLHYFENNFQFVRANHASHYVDHLRSIPQEDVHRYLGHLYVRYFGDMLGGNIIRQRISNNFQLPIQATNLYDFEAFHLAYPMGVDELRRSMDKISFSNKQVGEIIFEAKTAFDLNYEIMTRCLDCESPF